MKRKSGILMAMSSLPSPYGIGTMGKSAYEFVDFLKAADQSWWQLLPLGPTSYGDSPYASFSSFAGNPYFIDLDMLAQEGLITREEIGENWGEDPQRVDYGAVYAGRYPVLRLAFERGKTRLSQETEAFRRENASWVENYALFMALKNHFSMKCWVDWPEEDIRLHRPDAVERYRALLREDVDFWVFCQFLFYASGTPCGPTRRNRASALSAMCPSTWRWTARTCGRNGITSAWGRTVCPWRWRVCRRTLSLPTASSGAIPSMTGIG